MKRPRNLKLRDVLRSFCISDMPLLSSTHKEIPLRHVSGAEAIVDDNGYITTPVENFKGTTSVELNYVIITHGDLVDYSTLISKCWNELRELPEFELCKTEMESDFKISRHLGKTVGALDSASTYDVDFFIEEFLDQLLIYSKGIRWDEQSFHDLYESLESFFYSDVVDYTAFVAVWGFYRWPEASPSEGRGGISIGRAVLSKAKREAELPIHVTEHAKIVPILQSSIYKYFYMNGGFLPPVPGTWDFPYVLEFTGTAPKCFCEPGEHPRLLGSQQMNSEISRLVGAIRLFKRGAFQFDILGHVDQSWLRKSHKSGLHTPKCPLIHHTYEISSEEEKELRKFCEWFTALPHNESLELAINRLNLSYERNRFEDDLVDQFVAFEAMLIQPDDEYIRKALSRRTANLISTTMSEKQTVYDEIYEAYHVRGKIIHGDKKNEIASILKSKKNLMLYVQDIQELLRRTIKKYAQLVEEGQSKAEIIKGNDNKVPGRRLR